MRTGRRWGKTVMAIVASAALFTLYACSGGGGGGGTPAAGTAISAQGTMTKGSVIVNGVQYTAASTATIRIDDNPGRPETELRNGMQVKVKGRINNDRITGQFEKVEAEPGVRGTLSGKGADDFLVNGQHVVVDDSTVLEDRVAGVFTSINFNGLSNLNEVEVHGGRDDAGNIRATRVERRDDSPLDEVKGTISTAPTGSTFTLTNGTTSIIVNYSGAVIRPTGATLNLNDFVEVHGAFSAGTLTATLVDREDLEDAEFEPSEGDEFEVEGLISQFTVHPGTFVVGNQTVQTIAGTRFEGGIAADLANNIKVEAEGHVTGGVLIAEKIKFKDSIRIEANADANGSAGVIGLTVVTSSLTEVKNLAGSIGGILAGDGLKIRGYLNNGGTITATRIEGISAVGANNIRLQGSVSAKTPNTSLTILGITVDTTTVEAGGFRDINDVSITADAFFALVKITAPATLVKARGSFAAGTLSAKEVEIESD
jgi:hypothetical protein